jgi:thymidine phosphorylase
VIQEVRARHAGIVTRLAALPIGIAALQLGAGRRTKDDSVDHAVGIVCSAKRGQEVESGQVLADVHARDKDTASSAAEAVLAAYEISDEPLHSHREILLDVVA